MEELSITEKIDKLAFWLVYDREKPETCPKVGYLSYANGWTQTQWAVVFIVGDILCDAGLDERDYFQYKVDSSD